MQKIIVGNWKMHGSRETARALVAAVCAQKTTAQVVVCPPFTLLSDIAPQLGGSHVKLGAQDCSFQPRGAYTGDISAAMLKEAGCTHVIVGHSERRQYHFESNDHIRKKAALAMEAGLTPIICVGENAEERKSGRAEENVGLQLKHCLPDAGAGDFLLAYEPVWAIGSSQTPTLADIERMHAHIAGVTKAPILYGGSVKGANAREIVAAKGVSGVLVGGASLDAKEFGTIIEAANAA